MLAEKLYLSCTSSSDSHGGRGGGSNCILSVYMKIKSPKVPSKSWDLTTRGGISYFFVKKPRNVEMFRFSGKRR